MTAARKKPPDADPPNHRGAGRSARVNFNQLALRDRFSLTPAEARVVTGLLEGLSYAEIAERLGVSYHTVHTHVKAIHVKAGVRTNGRLLALLRRVQED